MNEKPNIMPLDYASPKPVEPSDWAKALHAVAGFISRRPPWMTAVVLVLLAWALGTYTPLDRFYWRGMSFSGWLSLAALLIPGALQRRNAGHLAVLVLLSVVLYPAHHRLVQSTQGLRIPYEGVLTEGLLLFILALVEAWFRHRTVRPLIVPLFAASLAATMLYLVAWFVVASMNLWIPTGQGGWISAEEAVKIIVQPWLAWLILPRALGWHMLTRRRPTQLAFMATCAVFLTFFELALVPLGRLSMRGYGPFGRAQAVAILRERGRPDDAECLWSALSQADWTAPCSQDFPPRRDWRVDAVQALSDWQPEASASRLAQLLLRKPNELLASRAAEVFAEHKRYETAPVLLRYALPPGKLPRFECTRALERMGLPEAALPLLFEAGIFGMSADYRQRLAALMGEDAGADLHAWLALIENTAATRPSPVPQPIRGEVHRVMACFGRYWTARAAYGIPAVDAAGRLDVDAPTTAALERSVEACLRRLGADPETGGPPSPE